MHLIFVTRFGEKHPEVWFWECIKQVLYKECYTRGVTIIRMESDVDHIHLLIEYPPTLSISSLVHNLKQVTTYRLWDSYPGYMKKHYWSKRTLWSGGYFACSVGNASKETVEQYIANQG